MLNIAKNVKNRLSAYSKVLENYMFMTALQIIGSAFGILIYPYLIRTLGAESYGYYVFTVSITSYFITFVMYGYNFTALKRISEHKENQELKNQTISEIFTAKLVLLIPATFIFGVLLMFVPFFRSNVNLLLATYLQIFASVIFPLWYFQGMQKMRVVTYIQLTFRLLSLPFIFILVKSPEDVTTYAVISSLSLILPAIYAQLWLRKHDGIRLKIVQFKSLKNSYTEALPYFGTLAVATVKDELLTLIIATVFGMRDVALFDLAKKIVTIPRLLTNSINNALFPKIIENQNIETLKKIIRYEKIIGLAVSGGIIILGYPAILLLGGIEMIGAYTLAIILSFTVLVWLLVGSYVNFIFVPRNLGTYVIRNQTIALISFIVFNIPLIFFQNIHITVLAMTLSGFAEIVYCNYLIRRYKLL